MLEGSDAQREREVATAYLPTAPDVWSLPDALARLVRPLQVHPVGAELRELVPRQAGASPLRARSAIASTFLAGLELARLEEVDLHQERSLGPIQISTLGRT
jgi:segregation and condensation protein A